MSSPFHTRCDACEVQLSIPIEFLAHTAETLHRLGVRLERGNCPTPGGQGPGAKFSMEEKLQSELAGLLDSEVQERKVQNLKLFTESLAGRDACNGRMHIPLVSIGQWLACLNDLRLLLAAERGFTGVITEHAPGDAGVWENAFARDQLLYMLLSYLQEDVLSVLGTTP